MHKSVQPYFSDSKEKSCFIAHTQKIYNKIICNRNFQQFRTSTHRRQKRSKGKKKNQNINQNKTTFQLTAKNDTELTASPVATGNHQLPLHLCRPAHKEDKVVHTVSTQ